MEELAKKYHATQFRNKNKVPYFEHCIGVASLVTTVLGQTGEADEESARDMRAAAFGHDLIEDTEVTEAEIIAASNERTLGYIRELSNPVDDAHTDAYMEQLANATEEARIVKYCDLLENTTSVCYGLNDLGLDWAHNFYLPILTRSTAVLAETSFEKYAKTAELLRAMLKVSTDLLYAKIKEKEEA